MQKLNSGLNAAIASPKVLARFAEWPHPSIAAEMMPDDGHLLDLFFDWTPDEKPAAAYSSTRRRGCLAIEARRRDAKIGVNRAVTPNKGY